MDHPVLPVDLAARRAERLAKEKKTVSTEQIAKLQLLKGECFSIVFFGFVENKFLFVLLNNIFKLSTSIALCPIIYDPTCIFIAPIPGCCLPWPC